MAVTPLEEWMQYLKDEYIKPDTTVPGLIEARDRLEYLRMTPEEQREYDYYLDTLVRDTDVMNTKLLEARIEGREQGRAEGREQGRAEGRAEGISNVARKMKSKGMPATEIAEITSLTIEEINAL